MVNLLRSKTFVVLLSASVVFSFQVAPFAGNLPSAAVVQPFSSTPIPALRSSVEPEAEIETDKVVPEDSKGEEEETTKLGRMTVLASRERVNQISYEAGAANWQLWAV